MFINREPINADGIYAHGFEIINLSDLGIDIHDASDDNDYRRENDWRMFND